MLPPSESTGVFLSSPKCPGAPINIRGRANGVKSSPARTKNGRPMVIRPTDSNPSPRAQKAITSGLRSSPGDPMPQNPSCFGTPDGNDNCFAATVPKNSDIQRPKSQVESESAYRIVAGIDNAREDEPLGISGRVPGNVSQKLDMCKALREKPLPTPPNSSQFRKNAAPLRNVVDKEEVPRGQRPQADITRRGISPVLSPSKGLKRHSSEQVSGFELTLRTERVRRLSASPSTNIDPVTNTSTSITRNASYLLPRTETNSYPSNLPRGSQESVELVQNLFLGDQSRRLTVMEDSDIPHNLQPDDGNYATQDNNASGSQAATPTKNRTEIPTKPNPFRDRLNASLSPNKAPKTPEFTEAGAPYDYDQDIPDQSPTPACAGRRQSGLAGTPSDANDDGKAEAAPHNARRISKIPRMSPMASAGNTSSNGSAENKRKSQTFNPGVKSGIPVPTRRLPNKYDGLKDANSSVHIPEEVENAQDTNTGSEGTDDTGNAEIGIAEAVPMAKLEGESQSEIDKSQEKASDNVEVLPGGAKLKHLTGRPNGPLLRIAPDAEKYIMGDGGGETDEGKQSGRRSGAKREFRLSTESFMGGLARKRNSRAFTEAAAHSSRTNASTTVDKPMQKVNNPEPPSRTPPSIPRARSRPLPAKGGPTTPTKRSTNPFFNSDDHGASPGPSGNKKHEEQQSSPDKVTPNGKSDGKPIYGDTVNGGGGDGSPLKNGQYRSSVSKEYLEQEDARSSKKIPRSPRTRAHVSRRTSYRRRSNERTTPLKSRANRATTVTADTSYEPNVAPETERKETSDMLQKRPRPSFARESKASELGQKPKVSTGRGVLQNFRGLFAKSKTDVPKGPSNVLPADTKSRSSDAKAPPNGVTSPRRKQALRNAPSRVFHEAETENAEAHQSAYEHPTRTIRPVYSMSRLSGSPAISDPGPISNLTMEILEAARLEPETSKKEKLIRIGKILIKAVNYSHDAEKAMLTAIQAAKEAEVSCAMAKENEVLLTQVVQEWVAAELHASPA